LPVNASDLQGAPPHISSALDEGRLVSLGLQRYIAEGLALKVPMDIPLPRYAEIVREYQPRIAAIIGQIVNKTGKKGAGFDAMSREISRINNEIDRIKNLKRYLIVEGMAEPIRKNKAMVAATLVAGTLGLVGSLPGCAGALAAGGAIKAAKRFKIGERLVASLKENKPLAKLTNRIRADVIQPQIEKIMACYLRADLPAVTVLALKRDLAQLN
jgi:hypothetical protein